MFNNNHHVTRKYDEYHEYQDDDDANTSENGAIDGDNNVGEDKDCDDDDDNENGESDNENDRKDIDSDDERGNEEDDGVEGSFGEGNKEKKKVNDESGITYTYDEENEYEDDYVKEKNSNQKLFDIHSANDNYAVSYDDDKSDGERTTKKKKKKERKSGINQVDDSVKKEKKNSRQQNQSYDDDKLKYGIDEDEGGVDDECNDHELDSNEKIDNDSNDYKGSDGKDDDIDSNINSSDDEYDKNDNDVDRIFGGMNSCDDDNNGSDDKDDINNGDPTDIDFGENENRGIGTDVGGDNGVRGEKKRKKAKLTNKHLGARTRKEEHKIERTKINIQNHDDGGGDDEDDDDKGDNEDYNNDNKNDFDYDKKCHNDANDKSFDNDNGDDETNNDGDNNNDQDGIADYHNNNVEAEGKRGKNRNSFLENQKQNILITKNKTNAKNVRNSNINSNLNNNNDDLYQATFGVHARKMATTKQKRQKRGTLDQSEKEDEMDENKKIKESAYNKNLNCDNKHTCFPDLVRYWTDNKKPLVDLLGMHRFSPQNGIDNNNNNGDNYVGDHLKNENKYHFLMRAINPKNKSLLSMKLFLFLSSLLEKFEKKKKKKRKKKKKIKGNNKSNSNEDDNCDLSDGHGNGDRDSSDNNNHADVFCFTDNHDTGLLNDALQYILDYNKNNNDVTSINYNKSEKSIFDELVLPYVWIKDEKRSHETESLLSELIHCGMLEVNISIIIILFKYKMLNALRCICGQIELNESSYICLLACIYSIPAPGGERLLCYLLNHNLFTQKEFTKRMKKIKEENKLFLVNHLFFTIGRWIYIYNIISNNNDNDSDNYRDNNNECDDNRNDSVDSSKHSDDKNKNGLRNQNRNNEKNKKEQINIDTNTEDTFTASNNKDNCDMNSNNKNKNTNDDIKNSNINDDNNIIFSTKCVLSDNNYYFFFEDENEYLYDQDIAINENSRHKNEVNKDYGSKNDSNKVEKKKKYWPERNICNLISDLPSLDIIISFLSHLIDAKAHDWLYYNIDEQEKFVFERVFFLLKIMIAKVENENNILRLQQLEGRLYSLLITEPFLKIKRKEGKAVEITTLY